MCYTQRKIEGGVGALRDADDTKFLKPNGQSRNLNIYGIIIISSSIIINVVIHYWNCTTPSKNICKFC